MKDTKINNKAFVIFVSFAVDTCPRYTKAKKIGLMGRIVWCRTSLKEFHSPRSLSLPHERDAMSAIPDMHASRALLASLAGLAWCLLPALAPADETEEKAAAARTYLESVQPDAELQEFLDGTVKKLLAKDARARKAKTVGIALIDLQQGQTPRLAHWNGDIPIYPASVVKFVYLMAAYAWEEQGILSIDSTLDRQLTAMIYKSSNTATQKVFRTLTETEAGSELDSDDYAAFRERRLRVKRWLENLGIKGIHSIHPTYNGGGDLYGRDIQLLQDGSVPGGLSNQSGSLSNRQAMTAVGTAKLLALLASNLGLDSEDAAEVRQRMKRDPRKQPYLYNRIAGGAVQTSGVEVYSKTGTWGPIYADAGIIRGPTGRQLALAVFIDSKPAYRGRFIAELARVCTAALLGPKATH